MLVVVGDVFEADDSCLTPRSPSPELHAFYRSRVTRRQPSYINAIDNAMRRGILQHTLRHNASCLAASHTPACNAYSPDIPTHCLWYNCQCMAIERLLTNSSFPTIHNQSVIVYSADCSLHRRMNNVMSVARLENRSLAYQASCLYRINDVRTRTAVHCT